MKKILLSTAILIFLSCFCYAQSDSLMGKEIIYKWDYYVAINSVDAQINQMLLNTWEFPYTNYYGNFGDKKDKSFSVSFIPKYRISANLFLRIEFGFTSIHLTSHYNGEHDSLSPFSANSIADNIIQQKIYRFVPGMQWNFMKKKHIESYCGSSLYYLQYSKLYYNLDIEDNYNVGRGTDYTTNTPGGFASGIGVFTGTGIHLNKHIAIGGELSYSLLYYKIGGIERGTETDTFPTSPSETFNFLIVNNRSEGIQFSKVMPSFNISLRL